MSISNQRCEGWLLNDNNFHFFRLCRCRLVNVCVEHYLPITALSLVLATCIVTKHSHALNLIHIFNCRCYNFELMINLIIISSNMTPFIPFSKIPFLKYILDETFLSFNYEFLTGSYFVTYKSYVCWHYYHYCYYTVWYTFMNFSWNFNVVFSDRSCVLSPDRLVY